MATEVRVFFGLGDAIFIDEPAFLLTDFLPAHGANNRLRLSEETHGGLLA